MHIWRFCNCASQHRCKCSGYQDNFEALKANILKEAAKKGIDVDSKAARPKAAEVDSDQDSRKATEKVAQGGSSRLEASKKLATKPNASAAKKKKKEDAPNAPGAQDDGFFFQCGWSR